MKLYDLIFFHVFKRYYKNGRFKNDIPWLTASTIVGMASFIYLVNIFIAGFYFIYKTSPEMSNKFHFITFSFVFILLNVLWFFINKRYLLIYQKYKEKYQRDKVTEILSWIYVIAPYPIFVIVVFLFRT